VKRETNRPIISKGSPTVPVLAALTLLVLAILSAPTLLEELKSGQSYSVAVIFANGTKVFRTGSPISFWLNMGTQILGFVIFIFFGIFIFCGVMIDYKRKKTP
jgi:hypothetical protein